MSGSSSNPTPPIIATASSSAAGGRLGWQGLRFEAAFATLNLIRSALSRSPLGLDKSTLRPIADPDRIEVNYKPQTEGAVDDLVAIDGGRRVVAYQLKSGMAQLPRSAGTNSETVSALEQAGRELRASDGATVVILVFGQLSPRMKTFARWLVDESSPKPTVANQDAIAKILGYVPGSVDWKVLKPRLRFLEMQTTDAIGASIDAELSSAYSSPADRLAVADAIRELVAFHSDTTGASLPAISTASLDTWIAQRGLPAITAQRRLDNSVPVIVRIADRFLLSVYRDRGPLPEIARTKFVEHVVSELETKDIALLGGGGNGKTEIEAQVLRHMLSNGWMPLVLRREDLSQSSDLASLLGAGGRTNIAKLVTDLLGQPHPERVLVLIDGLDELRRISPAVGHPRATELFDVLSGLRAVCPDHDRLRIIVSCRKYDWEKLGSSGWSVNFSTISLPDMSSEDLAPVQQVNLSPFSEFLGSLAGPLLHLLRSRPILLRLAFELWLHRKQVAAINLAPNLDDLTSEVELWLRYFDECVCRSDEGLVAAIPSGDVIRCHEAMARMHIEGDLFVLSVPARPLERDYARAFPWLRSLDVAISEGEPPASRVRFFHPAYTDFALAQVLAENQGVSLEWARREQLAVSLFPVWQRIPAFWAISAPHVALLRTREMLQNEAIPYLVKHALIDGWFERAIDEGTLADLASIVAACKGQTALLQYFISTATNAAQTKPTEFSALGWLRVLIVSNQLVDVELDCLLRFSLKLVESRPMADSPLHEVIRDAGWRGLERAEQLALTDAGVQNARILARNAVELLSYVLRPELIIRLPIEASSWIRVGDNNRAAELASDIRFVLTQKEAILRMHKIAADGTKQFLIKILTTFPDAEDRMVPMSAPQQTARLSLRQGLKDSWAQSWHAIEFIFHHLLEMDSQNSLEVTIAAWQTVGRLWRSQTADENKRFPVEAAGDPWLHDASYWWWGSGSIGDAGTAHAQIARRGFDFVAARLAEEDLAPLRRLISLIREVRWAGLVGVALRIAAEGFKSQRLSSAGRSEAAGLVVDMVLEKRSYYYPEFRHQLAQSLPILFPYLDRNRQEAVYAELNDLKALDRLANESIQEPDLETFRKEHQAKLATLRAQETAGKVRAQGQLAARLAYMESQSPDAVYNQQYLWYKFRMELRDIAKKGEIPWQHHDVEWMLSVLEQFFNQGLERYLPSDFLEFRTAFIVKFGKEAIPQSKPAVYMTSSTPTETQTPAQEEADPNSSLDGFRKYVTSLQHQRLNKREPLSTQDQQRLKKLLEEWRRKSAFESAVKEDHVDAENNSHDKLSGDLLNKSWLQLLVLYLEGLPQDAPCDLTDDTILMALSLSTDLDPVDDVPASLDVISTVRGLAAEGLALLRRAGGPPSTSTAFVSLVKDKCAGVRQNVYYRAQWLRQIEPGIYSQILEWFAANEMDPFLIGHWGPPCLFGRTCSPQELEVFDRACATLLSRCYPITAEDSELSSNNLGTGSSDHILHIAVFLALHGGVKCFAELKKLVVSPAWLVSYPALAQKIITELMASFSESKCEPASALELLDGFQMRSQQSMQLASKSQVPNGLERELNSITEVAACIGATLIGIPHGGRLAITESDIPTAPRLTRLTAGITAVEKPMYAVWKSIITTWGGSTWKVSMQRLLCDALYVMYEFAQEACADVTSILVQWQLLDVIPRTEYAVRVALTRLLGALLDSPDNSYPQQFQEYLVILLQALATSGHSESLTIIHRLAERARQS